MGAGKGSDVWWMHSRVGPVFKHVLGNTGLVAHDKVLAQAKHTTKVAISFIEAVCFVR
jgi:hypothetical protein